MNNPNTSHPGFVRARATQDRAWVAHIEGFIEAELSAVQYLDQKIHADPENLREVNSEHLSYIAKLAHIAWNELKLRSIERERWTIDDPATVECPTCGKDLTDL